MVSGIFRNFAPRFDYVTKLSKRRYTIMNEKKKFEKPSVEEVKLRTTDIICESCTVYDCSNDDPEEQELCPIGG